MSQDNMKSIVMCFARIAHMTNDEPTNLLVKLYAQSPMARLSKDIDIMNDINICQLITELIYLKAYLLSIIIINSGNSQTAGVEVLYTKDLIDDIKALFITEPPMFKKTQLPVSGEMLELRFQEYRDSNCDIQKVSSIFAKYAQITDMQIMSLYATSEYTKGVMEYLVSFADSILSKDVKTIEKMAKTSTNAKGCLGSVVMFFGIISVLTYSIF